MKIRSFKPDDYPSIVNIHNSLNIVWPEKPRTVKGWEDADKQRSPKCNFHRIVAGDGTSVFGFGNFGNNLFDYHPQKFYINIEVHPDHQNKGIGAALYEQIIAGLDPLNPRILRTDAFANLPQGFRFLQKRGFYEAFRETPVHLDIQSFDPSPYSNLESELLAQGIIIKTLRELENEPDRNRKIYDLYWEVTQDVPQEDQKIEQQSFEEWMQWGLNDPGLLPDAYFVAIHGSDYIGLRELYKDSDNNMLLGGLLGVRRAYRKRGIGLAMQLRGIKYAREHGIPVLKTCTAIQNYPMQAFFNKLGYQRDPEWQQCQKDL